MPEFIALAPVNLLVPSLMPPLRVAGNPLRTAWAAKIAARLGVPVLPSYYRSSGRRVEAIMGEPIISDAAGAIVQHYVGFFERHIIEDPASWSFLGDKRWIRVLRRACEADRTLSQA